MYNRWQDFHKVLIKYKNAILYHHKYEISKTPTVSRTYEVSKSLINKSTSSYDFILALYLDLHITF